MCWRRTIGDIIIVTIIIVVVVDGVDVVVVHDRKVVWTMNGHGRRSLGCTGRTRRRRSCAVMRHGWRRWRWHLHNALTSIKIQNIFTFFQQKHLHVWNESIVRRNGP